MKLTKAYPTLHPARRKILSDRDLSEYFSSQARLTIFEIHPQIQEINLPWTDTPNVRYQVLIAHFVWDIFNHNCSPRILAVFDARNVELIPLGLLSRWRVRSRMKSRGGDFGRCGKSQGTVSGKSGRRRREVFLRMAK